MSEPRVRNSGLSKWATILMFFLGLFAFIFVNGVAGLAIMALAGAMYLFNRWLRGKAARALQDHKNGPS